jgi:hypothetical protein
MPIEVNCPKDVVKLVPEYNLDAHIWSLDKVFVGCCYLTSYTKQQEKPLVLQCLCACLLNKSQVEKKRRFNLTFAARGRVTEIKRHLQSFPNSAMWVSVNVNQATLKFA